MSNPINPATGKPETDAERKLREDREAEDAARDKDKNKGPAAAKAVKDERPRCLFLPAGTNKRMKAAINGRSDADPNVCSLEILEGDRKNELEDSVVKWSGKGDRPQHHCWIDQE